MQQRSLIEQQARFRRLVVALLLLGIGLAIAVRYLLADLPFGLAGHASSSDYLNIFTAATLISGGHGHASDLYNLALQTSAQQQLAPYGAHFPDGLLPFISPPFVAIVITPLVGLPIGTGFLLWVALELTALLLLLWLLAPLLPPRYRYLLWLGAFAFMPVQQVLDQGQVSCLLLLGIVLLWRGLRSGGNADWWAGAGFGLCLLKPQMLPIFIIYLLYLRRWRAIAGFSAVAAAWYLLSALVSGFDWPSAYLSTVNWVGNQRNHYSVYPAGMFSWRAALAGFDADSTLLVTAVSVFTGLLLIFSWWRTHQFQSGPLQTSTLDLQLAAITVAALLDSFYLNNQDLTVLLFSGAVLLGWAAQHGWPTWASVLLLADLLAPITAVNGWPMSLLVITTMAVTLLTLVRLSLWPELVATVKT